MSSAKVVDYSLLFAKLDKRVNKAFDDQVEFLQDLVKINSANPYSPEESPRNKAIEQKAVHLIWKKLKNLDLNPRKIYLSAYRPNLLVNVGPKRFRKSLILSGHTDTASPTTENWTRDPFAAEIESNKLYGAGALDMKGSLSAYLFALQAILSEKINLDGKLTLMFTADGLTGASCKFGTDFLMQKGLRAKAAILGEPGTGKIAIGHRGGYRFQITTHGESVHAGRSAWEKKEKGRNAILDMAQITVALQEMQLPYKPARAFPGRIPVFTFPTKITGGKTVNMVPDKCVAEGDVRLMPGNSDKQVRMWIEDCLSEHKIGAVYEIDDLAYVPSVEILKCEEIVETLYKNAVEVLGRKPRIAGAGPWNEAWMFVTRDVPTVAGFGPDGDHGQEADEYVDLDSLKQVTKIYARTIIEYLGIAK